jgi:effector-binding domain-containing protein
VGYEIEVIEVEAVPTAVMIDTTTADAIAATIRRLLDPVWAHIRSSDLVPGHNIVLYRGAPQQPGGAEIEVGVQVDRRIEETTATGVRGSELPAGRVARTVHVGHYDALGDAYEALDRWAADAGETLGLPFWEIYGDWQDDPAKLETVVSHLLR